MIAKTFEIRDKGTFVPVLAVKLTPDCEDDRYLLARAGFGRWAADQSKYVVLVRIAGGVGAATSDPHGWLDGCRTMPVAHLYIVAHWSDLKSGAVVDVEFILGERQTPKTSESVTAADV